MSKEQPMLLHSPRQLNQGLPLQWKQHPLLKRLRKANRDASPREKPKVMKSHLKDMIILPKMLGMYKCKTFNQVEINPEMTSQYLGEFSIAYKPVKNGQPGTRASHSSHLIPFNKDSRLVPGK
ncbi:small ribosomal subunit protein uS19-like [Meriones unguiculatus]|uniref:small ribosomal subunit protein uS19-like n=1 Tax=Meriones unguiculatus TaxID=10047 RepID=UPI00293F6163|nr:small ribosomal subunit protein uS19-like [Meriones unguiculatus]